MLKCVGLLDHAFHGVQNFPGDVLCMETLHPIALGFQKTINAPSFHPHITNIIIELKHLMIKSRSVQKLVLQLSWQCQSRGLT